MDTRCAWIQALRAEGICGHRARPRYAARAGGPPRAGKTLEDFDFTFRPSIKREQIDSLHEHSAMGHAADLALGVALARPDRQVICLNGDGSMLMTLGTLVTIVECGAENLILFVFENGTYEITGSQRVPGAGTVDFSAMARAAGFDRVFRFDEAIEYERALPEVLAGEGPVFVSLVMKKGAEGPISRTPDEPSAYLQVSLAESARRVRTALIGG